MSQKTCSYSLARNYRGKRKIAISLAFNTEETKIRENHKRREEDREDIMQKPRKGNKISLWFASNWK